MKRLLLLIALTVLSTTSRAQQYDPAAALKDFDYVVAKVKNDYPGYGDKVKPTKTNPTAKFVFVVGFIYRDYRLKSI